MQFYFHYFCIFTALGSKKKTKKPPKKPYLLFFDKIRVLVGRNLIFILNKLTFFKLLSRLCDSLVCPLLLLLASRHPITMLNYAVKDTQVPLNVFTFCDFYQKNPVLYRVQYYSNCAIAQL